MSPLQSESTGAITANALQRPGLIVACVSTSIISFEITWTRILSAEFFYSFTFLILSLAVLGLGLGGLVSRAAPRIHSSGPLSLLLTAAALSAFAAPLTVLRLGLDFTGMFAGPEVALKLLAAIVLLTLPFLLAGTVAASVFRQTSQRIHPIYMFDMVGAGLGAVAAVFLMNTLQVPAAAVLAVAPLLIAAAAISRGTWRILPVVTGGLLLALIPSADSLYSGPRSAEAPALYTRWHAMARVDVRAPSHHRRVLTIDNTASSLVYRFPGFQRLPEKSYAFSLDVSHLIKITDPCAFLSVGAGGGAEVLQALLAGAGDIHAVEINPAINNLLLSGDLADFSGNIYNHPRVTVVDEDARLYARCHPGRFDLIVSVSSNTYAALVSGSFALAENYLYTVEAFKDFISALTPGGFLVLEHQFYIPRLLPEAIAAMREMGYGNPSSHLAVYNFPQSRRTVMLVGKAPLDAHLVPRAVSAPQGENMEILYPAPDPKADNLIAGIITRGWRHMQPQVAIDLSPCRDDRPFTPQLGMWKNFNFTRLDRLFPFMEITGFPLAESLILMIIIVTVILILPLNLLPYRLGKNRLAPAAWIYFFLIGSGFMMIEIVLIQRYTLFVGPSSYTVLVILVTLLVGSGIGSRLAFRVPGYLPFIGIVLSLILGEVLFESVILPLTCLSLSFRLLLTCILLAPLGFFMGMPFPIGGRRAGSLLDWGFAVNGAASVLGSAVVMLLAFSLGLRAALLISALIYTAAYGALRFGSWHKS